MRRASARRGQTFAPEDNGVNVGDEGDTRFEAAVEMNNVDRALARLPDDQREALMLVLVERFAYKEAADIIGCPINGSSRSVRLATKTRKLSI